MKCKETFEERLWSAVQKQNQRGKRITRAGLGVLAVGAVLTVALLPNRASAWPKVVQRLTDFNSVQWTQHDEGIITNLGSEDGQRVRFFERSSTHFASFDPPRVARKRASEGWLGMRKDAAGTLAYAPEPSSGLNAEDVRMLLAHFDNLGAFRSAQMEYETDYLGQRVRAFDLRGSDSDRTVKMTCFAGADNLRLVFLELHIYGPEHELLFKRTISNVKFDRSEPE